jgi:hypothetical protein
MKGNASIGESSLFFKKNKKLVMGQSVWLLPKKNLKKRKSYWGASMN